MRRKIKVGWLLGGLFLPVVVLAFAVTTLLYHPHTPLPPEWNPTRPLDPKAPLTRITRWKLARTVADPQLCTAALGRIAASVVALPPQEQNNQCHIRNRVQLSDLATARVATLETRCDTALRLAMWEHHSLQIAAQALLGARISRIHHFGSYSCRTIAGSSRMSQHATANALDISGFDLADGQEIRLRHDWQATGNTAEFLRVARDGACDWFPMVLSPDYNAAHHDHFHLDQGRWTGCR